MERFFTRADFDRAARYIAECTPGRPTLGIVLGSGLGSLADDITDAVRIPYRQVPNFPVSTVEGHSGELVVGALGGKTVIAMRGRAHFYEGYSMQQVTFPIRALRALGVQTLIVTNAAGGVNPDFRAGDLMLITDHVNLIGMAGNNPLRGPNDDSLGPRFPGMSEAYDPVLREKASAVASRLGISLRDGVYAMQAGPSFESPADVRFLQIMGADAVGMSTVPEVIVARHGGMRVLGFSLIANSLSGNHAKVSHEEVLAAGQQAVPKFAGLVRQVIAEI